MVNIEKGLLKVKQKILIIKLLRSTRKKFGERALSRAKDARQA